MGFTSIRLFYRGDPVHGIPLLVTVCSPGGSYSNWWCSLFNSDLPLSMAMQPRQLVCSRSRRCR